tara:strand:+ start:5261 stop:6481 length:1221 start_codon:yes stop_codon:yes gene_type:complete
MQQDKINKKIDSFFGSRPMTLEELISEQLNPILELLQEGPVSPEVGIIKSKEDGEKATTKDFLDIGNIVTMFVSRTETKETDISVEESFNVLKQFNKPENLDTAAGLNDYLISFFQSKEKSATEFGECTDIGTISKRLLINSAYSRILSNYNESAAGFVNEAFLSKLLGGAVVSTGSKITGTIFNDIADLGFSEGALIGVSLKTKKSGVKGSIVDLLATVGVPFKYTDNRGKMVTFEGGASPYPGGLFYVFFGKPRGSAGGSLDRFSITTARVTPESASDYVASYDIPMQDGYFIINPENRLKPEKDSRGLLGAGKDYSKFGSIRGVADHASEDLIFNKQKEFNKLQAEALGEELTKTLNTLNAYFSSLQKSIMTYASDPSPNNLESFQRFLLKSANFEIEKLLIC